MAGLATFPVHNERRRTRTKLNRVETMCPFFSVDKLAWPATEDFEFRGLTEDPARREAGKALRSIRYLWRHVGTDLVVDSADYSPVTSMGALVVWLDQLKAQGWLSVSNGNRRVGSAGLGITDEFPQPDYDGIHAGPINQRETSTGQVFADVSPATRDAYCLRHRPWWLARFGPDCYGCCEPLPTRWTF